MLFPDMAADGEAAGEREPGRRPGRRAPIFPSVGEYATMVGSGAVEVVGDRPNYWDYVDASYDAAQETEWGVFPSDFYLNPPKSGPPGGDPGPGVGGGPAPDPDHDDDDKDEEDEEEEDKEEDKEKDDEDEDKDDKEGAGGGGASGGAGPGFPDHVRPAPPDPLELEPCQDRELATRKCRQLATIRGCPKTYYCVASGPACEVQVDCLEDVIRWAAPGRRVELR